MLTGLSPPLSPRSNRIRERREEHLSLLSETMKADVLDPLGLASSLYEDLTRDKGRVLTFVPSGRASGSAKVDELRAKRSKRDRRSFATGQAVGSPRRSSRRRAVTVDDRDRESEQWPELVLSSVRDFLNSVWDQADHDFTKVGSLGRTVSFKDLSIDQNAKVTISKIVTGRLSNGQRNGESLSFGSNLVDGAEGGERTKDYGSGRPKGILRRPRTRSKKTIAKAATSITRRVVRTLWWIFGIGWRRPSRSAPPYLSSSLEANSSADGSRADVEDALPSLARLPTQSQARPPSKPVTTNTREVINGSHLVRSFLIKILELSDEVIALFYPFETLKGHEHDGSRNRHGKGGAGKRAKSRRSYDSARVFSSVSYLAPTWIKENVFDPLEAIWMDSDQDEANTVSCGHAPFDGRGMNRSSLECERQGVDAERFFNIQGGDESDDAQGEDDSALYEVLRLALTDPQPRRSYHVGLGPRLQGIFDGIQNLLTGMIEIC
ncbi:hypothetical protein IE53DRAFT_126017 [Violaceomyces palustris]|uniref:Uncharacterized protein n=1 Tax=Violaceomyces palustris TaxID=1673888 RepID=A0ACD0NVH2_9BASI|nr:hypothetical protein IE53DRAFT_126017 [Violaceomyces palustris]